MSRQEWQMVASASSGRYRQLSRPIGLPGEAGEAGPPPDPFVISVHSQTLLFLLFAILVGIGLLMIVPILSAAPDGAASGMAGGQHALAESSAASVNSVEAAVPLPVSLDNQGMTAELAPPPTNGISPVFTQEVRHWESKILEWSQLYNLDPDIIATIMQIESCGDPGVASHAGAQGLFQVMPFHFDAGEDMLDPDTNAQRGMAFYNRQLEYTGWDIYLSFAGYNGGYAASGSSYPYWANETQRYYTWAKGIYDEAKAGLEQSPTLQRWLEAGGGSGCHRAAQRLGL